MEIIKDLFEKSDWKILVDAVKARTQAGELSWSLDLDTDEDRETSYLAAPSKDMCVYVVRTMSKTPKYEIGAQQLKRGLWGVLKSTEVSTEDEIDLQELFEIVDNKVAEPDLQLQTLMKEEFLVDLMGALDEARPGATEET